MWAKAKIYVLGGLGVLGVLTAIALAIAVHAWLGERDKRVLAEDKAKAETTRADTAEARTLEILEAYDDADAQSAERRDEIRAVEKTGVANPAVGPRSGAVYRKLRQQRERDKQGTPGR